MHPTVRIGDTYVHKFQGRDWRVTVTALEPKTPNGRREWNGQLAEAYDDLPAGSTVWGYVDELRKTEGKQ